MFGNRGKGGRVGGPYPAGAARVRLAYALALIYRGTTPGYWLSADDVDVATAIAVHTEMTAERNPD